LNTLTEFDIGDPVRIRADSRYYKHDSINNPRDKVGEVTEINTINYSDPHPITVQWDEHSNNVYRASDLEHAYSGVLWT
jgi:hypothetical protein